MHLAQIVDVGDIDAARVAPPLPQLGLDVRRPLGETPPHPQQEEGAVGILVAGGVFALSSFLPFLQTALEERLQRPAGGLDRGVLSAVLAPRPA